MPTEEITIEDFVNWYLEEKGIEIWKDIPGYEGLYQVSNTGKVKSLERNCVTGRGGIQQRGGTILKPRLDKYGYPRLCLSKNGKPHHFTVHQLVARVWVPNPHNYPQVNHIDEDKTNANAANLEWVEASFNNAWGTRNDRIGISQKGLRKSKHLKPVVQYTLSGEFIKEYPSAYDVMLTLGYDKSSIRKCCRGVIKTSYGYIWKEKGEAV